MTTNPLVSICIPTYNREKIIAHTIDSVINQSYLNIEVVISDNCSSDKTFEILKSYSLKDSRIKIFKMQENVGPVENWRNCNNNANGKFIKFLWSDDFIDKDFIEKTIHAFNKDIGFVYTPVKWFNVNSMHVNSDNIGYQMPNSQVYPISFFVESLIVDGTAPVSASCALFRKEVLDDLFSSNIENCIGLNCKINGAGIDSLMFLYAINKYHYFSYVNSSYAYFGVGNDGITIRDGSKLYPYYFSTFYDFLIKHNSNSNLISKLKSKIFIYKVFFTNDKESIILLNRLLDIIKFKVNYIYVFRLAIKKVFIKKYINILKRIIRRIL